MQIDGLFCINVVGDFKLSESAYLKYFDRTLYVQFLPLCLGQNGARNTVKLIKINSYFV